MNKQRKLKLCLIGDISNVHCQRWVNFFVDRGHEVHFIDNHKYQYKNLKLHYLKNYTGIRLIDYLYRLVRAKKIIKKIKPDLLHSQQVTYHGFLGALSGVHPFMITPWGADILYDPEKSFINKKIMKFVFDNADVIHYIDQSVVDRVSDIYGETKNKVFLLNEGVNTKIFRKIGKAKTGNKVSIVLVRIPSKMYNTILFVKAMDIVINKYGCENIIGIMCNKGDYRYREVDYEKRIDKLINKHNLRNYMKFFKYVRDLNYTHRIMKDADIYVDTMDRTIKGQGTGKTALEAMSSELAMIMPDNPSIELYIKHMKNGIIYKKNNVESLAKALVMLIKNTKLRLKLGKNARKFILDNLDWDKNMKIMEKKYYELVNKNF